MISYLILYQHTIHTDHILTLPLFFWVMIEEINTIGVCGMVDHHLLAMVDI